MPALRECSRTRKGPWLVPRALSRVSMHAPGDPFEADGSAGRFPVREGCFDYETSIKKSGQHTRMPFCFVEVPPRVDNFRRGILPFRMGPRLDGDGARHGRIARRLSAQGSGLRTRQPLQLLELGLRRAGAPARDRVRRQFRRVPAGEHLRSGPHGRHRCRSYRKIVPYRAHGYSTSEDGIINTWWLDMYLLTGSGNLYSTVRDLLKWD